MLFPTLISSMPLGTVLTRFCHFGWQLSRSLIAWTILKCWYFSVFRILGCDSRRRQLNKSLEQRQTSTRWCWETTPSRFTSLRTSLNRQLIVLTIWLQTNVLLDFTYWLGNTMFRWVRSMSGENRLIPSSNIGVL